MTQPTLLKVFNELLAACPNRLVPVAIAASCHTWQVIARRWHEIKGGQPFGGGIQVIRLIHAERLGILHPEFVQCFGWDMVYAFEKLDHELRNPMLADASPAVIDHLFNTYCAEFKEKQTLGMPVQFH